MKRHSLFIFHLSFFLVVLFFVSGCDSGGGGGDGGKNKGTAPTINSVTIYRCDDQTQNNCVESTSLKNGGYWYDIIHCSDPDLDIINLHWTVYAYTGNQYVIDTGPQVLDVPSQNDESVSYIWDPDLVRALAGTYRFEYQMEDEAGNLSNVFKVSIVVE
jgi:hypothetical protein